MRSKGFTLVEILVVVVIMAFVISVAVLSVGTAGRDSLLGTPGSARLRLSPIKLTASYSCRQVVVRPPPHGRLVRAPSMREFPGQTIKALVHEPIQSQEHSTVTIGSKNSLRP